MSFSICPHFFCNEGYLILPFEGLIDELRQTNSYGLQ